MFFTLHITVDKLLFIMPSNRFELHRLLQTVMYAIRDELVICAW